MLDEHVLRERREHEAVAAEVVLAQRFGQLAGEELEAILHGARAQVVAEGDERGGADGREIADGRLHQLDARASEVSKDR